MDFYNCTKTLVIEIYHQRNGGMRVVSNDVGFKRGRSERLVTIFIGYTEPDPRHDLSSIEFARKFFILALEMWLNKEHYEVPVLSLVPPKLAYSVDLSIDPCMKQLPIGS